MMQAEVAPLTPLGSFVFSAQVGLIKLFGKCCYIE